MPDVPRSMLPAVYAGDRVAHAFADGIRAALAPSEDCLDRLAEVLDPWAAPASFLDWLAHLTGARVEPDWTELQWRTAVALAPWLAAHRGTRQALLREAREIYGWVLDVKDLGGVFTGDRRPPAGRMLTVTLILGSGEDRLTAERRLTRLVVAHCPAHLPFKTVVTADH
ncbi:phage tail protein [Streptomyces sp. NPDC046261]|uniref:phage tail protein n=1 Tax=Streptomyces sp. NPDC046261 TaxID=3157200 RepID=UPI0033CF899F